MTTCNYPESSYVHFFTIGVSGKFLGSNLSIVDVPEPVYYAYNGTHITFFNPECVPGNFVAVENPDDGMYRFVPTPEFIDPFSRPVLEIDDNLQVGYGDYELRVFDGFELVLALPSTANTVRVDLRIYVPTESPQLGLFQLGDEYYIGNNFEATDNQESRVVYSVVDDRLYFNEHVFRDGEWMRVDRIMPDDINGFDWVDGEPTIPGLIWDDDGVLSLGDPGLPLRLIVSEDMPHRKKKGLSGLAIGLIIGGGVVLVALLLFIGFSASKKKRDIRDIELVRGYDGDKLLQQRWYGL